MMMDEPVASGKKEMLNGISTEYIGKAPGLATREKSKDSEKA
jgi:hypothetical protein